MDDMNKKKKKKLWRKFSSSNQPLSNKTKSFFYVNTKPNIYEREKKGEGKYVQIKNRKRK